MLVNIPTPIALALPALCHALERYIARCELPDKTTVEIHHMAKGTQVRATLGTHSLELPLEMAERLRATARQRRARLMRYVPKLLCGILVLARRDHLAGLDFEPGTCALVRASSTNSQRLAAICGLDPERSDHLRLVRSGLRLLEAMTLRIGELKMDGLFSWVGKRTLRSKDLDEGVRRGGSWHLAQLHPELVELMFSRFVQLDAAALAQLKPHAFNLWLAMLAQRHLRYGQGALPEGLGLHLPRVIRDAALSQTSRRGEAREREYLEQALAELQAEGLIKTWEHREKRKLWVELEPPKLSPDPPPTPKAGASEPSKPPKLAQQVSQDPIESGGDGILNSPVRASSKSSGTLGRRPQGASASEKKRAKAHASQKWSKKRPKRRR